MRTRGTARRVAAAATVAAPARPSLDQDQAPLTEEGEVDCDAPKDEAAYPENLKREQVLERVLKPAIDRVALCAVDTPAHIRASRILADRMALLEGVAGFDPSEVEDAVRAVRLAISAKSHVAAAVATAVQAAEARHSAELAAATTALAVSAKSQGAVAVAAAVQTARASHLAELAAAATALGVSAKSQEAAAVATAVQAAEARHSAELAAAATALAVSAKSQEAVAVAAAVQERDTQHAAAISALERRGHALALANAEAVRDRRAAEAAATLKAAGAAHEAAVFRVAAESGRLRAERARVSSEATARLEETHAAELEAMAAARACVDADFAHASAAAAADAAAARLSVDERLELNAAHEATLAAHEAAFGRSFAAQSARHAAASIEAQRRVATADLRLAALLQTEQSHAALLRAAQAAARSAIERVEVSDREHRAQLATRDEGTRRAIEAAVELTSSKAHDHDQALRAAHTLEAHAANVTFEGRLALAVVSRTADVARARLAAAVRSATGVIAHALRLRLGRAMSSWKFQTATRREALRDDEAHDARNPGAARRTKRRLDDDVDDAASDAPSQGDPPVAPPAANAWRNCDALRLAAAKAALTASRAVAAPWPDAGALRCAAAALHNAAAYVAVAGYDVEIRAAMDDKERVPRPAGVGPAATADETAPSRTGPDDAMSPDLDDGRASGSDAARRAKRPRVDVEGADAPSSDPPRRAPGALRADVAAADAALLALLARFYDAPASEVPHAAAAQPCGA